MYEINKHCKLFLKNILLVIFSFDVYTEIHTHTCKYNIDVIDISRLRRIRSREESVLDSGTTRKEFNPKIDTEIRPDVFSTLRKSRPQRQIENLQKPFQTKTHESQPSLKQQPRDHSRHPIKRLKVRSIGSTYEVDDNEVHEIIHESIPEEHDEGPIYIKPVVRVIKKNGILDSILDILQQLLAPAKKGTGPIVGPIKMPGSKRKIYLRLLEPVDSSHINVRFVTQIPVPVVDEESVLSREHESFLPFLPFVDHGTTLLNRHPIATSDATLSSSNRHHSVQLPRNASHAVSSKDRRSQPKPAIKLKRPSAENDQETDQVSPVKVEAASGAESEKNHLYYPYQSENDAVRTVTEIIKDATETKRDPKDFLEPWYQLTTHRLPLRQIAPLYPLSAMEHEDAYKVPSDSLTVPDVHSSSYEQYSNVNAGASGVYDQSSSYTIPNTYQKQNEFSNAPSSYPISYQTQNEYNNAPSSTSYVKQNDLFIAPTSHTSSYEKPANVPLSSSSYATSQNAQTHDIQTSSSSSPNALRVTDPPFHPFLDPRLVLEHHANKVIQQPNYHLPNVNDIVGSMPRNPLEKNGDQITWGKIKREKSESQFQKSVEVTSDANREKWQPLMLVSENADWHKAFANSAEVANGNQHEITQPSIDRPRQASRNTMPANTKAGKVDQRGGQGGQGSQSGKRRNHSAAKCLPSDKRDGCGRIEFTILSHPGDSIKIADGQAQSAADIEPIVITPKSLASNTVEIRSRSNVTTKSSWIEEPQPLVMTTETLVASGATAENPPLLSKLMKNITEKSIDKKTTTRGSMMNNNITEKLAANDTTERSSIAGTSKMSIPRNNTTRRLQLPKRPMIMKKPPFVLKEMESSRRIVASSTTRKPTIATTTEKTKATKRLTFRSEILKTKSSTI